jgi:hypothetical protein
MKNFLTSCTKVYFLPPTPGLEVKFLGHIFLNNTLKVLEFSEIDS